MLTAIAAGLINWIVTTILVESEITRPVREWVTARRERGYFLPQHHPVWWKVSYFLGCHLCTGTWVAFVEALILGPLIGAGWTGIILTTFLIKAIGHFTLEFTALFRRWSQ